MPSIARPNLMSSTVAKARSRPIETHRAFGCRKSKVVPHARSHRADVGGVDGTLANQIDRGARQERMGLEPAVIPPFATVRPTEDSSWSVPWIISTTSSLGDSDMVWGPRRVRSGCRPCRVAT